MSLCCDSGWNRGWLCDDSMQRLWVDYTVHTLLALLSLTDCFFRSCPSMCGKHCVRLVGAYVLINHIDKSRTQLLIYWSETKAKYIDTWLTNIWQIFNTFTKIEHILVLSWGMIGWTLNSDFHFLISWINCFIKLGHLTHVHIVQLLLISLFFTWSSSLWRLCVTPCCVSLTHCRILWAPALNLIGPRATDILAELSYVSMTPDHFPSMFCKV